MQAPTARGVRVEFVTEGLAFTGADSRALLWERQREGIALARQRGAYRGRRKALTAEQVAEMRRRVSAGEPKARVARELGVSRETLYQYLRNTG